MRRDNRIAIAMSGILAIAVLPYIAPMGTSPDLAYATGECQPTGSSYVADGTNGTNGVTYQVLTFSDVGSCDWSVPEGVNTIDALVVGGGGGGGGREWAGGGGAGGVLYGDGIDVADYVTDGDIAITVGDGGVGGSGDSGVASRGSNGGLSQFGSVQASGGGGGGGVGWNLEYDGSGAAGGSGGGVGEHGSSSEVSGELLYALDDPSRDSTDSLQYRSGYGLGNSDAAARFDAASKDITRVSYRMKLILDGEERFAEVRFDPWKSGLTAEDLRVPDLTPTEHFEVQEVVKNMVVDSNMNADVSTRSDGVTNARGQTGYLELWPWNFSRIRSDGTDSDGDAYPVGGNDSFDFNDSPSVGVQDHGSFQVHNVTSVGSEETVISWTLHRKNVVAETGLGNQSSDNPDWTNTANSLLKESGYSTNSWSFEIRVNKEPFRTLLGGTSNLSAPTGWTAYGNAGGQSDTMASQAGSGGGGAGAVGGDVPFTSFQTIAGVRQDREPGDGGAGQAFNITGASVDYAEGGGGASSSATDSVCSDGGSGGGGAGACGNERGASGTDGLGGGGGGSMNSQAGGDGGSGVVIVRYALNSGEPSITVGSPLQVSGSTVSIPVTVNNILSGNYQAFVSIPEGAGTLSITSSAVTALFGYDSTSFTRSSGRELGFTGSLSEVQGALNTLIFTPASGTPETELTVSVTQAPSGSNAENIYYFPDNGHYYEFVDQETSIRWDTARTGAGQKSLFGMDGYLVTITSLSEQDFVRDQIDAPDIWIGATDQFELINAARGDSFFSGQRTGAQPSEGKWHWVTGPEAGTQFWKPDTSGQFDTQGRGQGGQSVDSEFSAWCSNEPNNRETSTQDEHYAAANYTCSTAPTSSEYNWNDFLIEADPVAYLVEYGGVDGEVSTAISTTTTQWVVPEAPTGVTGVTGDGEFTLSWSPASDSSDFVTNYEYRLDAGSWVSLGSTATEVTVAVDDVCQALLFEVRAVIGSQAGPESDDFTVSGCNAITIVDSGGAAQGSGWSNTSDTITATQDVSINASVISGLLDAGDLTIRSLGGGSVTVDSGARVTKDAGGPATLTLETSNINLRGTSRSARAVLEASGSSILNVAADSEQVALAHAVIDSNGGNISLNAQLPGIASGRAIQISDSEVSTIGSGTISISGDASLSANTGSSAWGVTFIGSSTIESQSGDIAISGVGGKLSSNSRGIVADNQDFQVLSVSGAITLTDTLPDGRTSYSGAYLNPSGSGIILGSTDGSSSSDVTINSDRVTFEGGDTTIRTTGGVTIAPVGSSFLNTLTTSFLNIHSDASSVVFGRAGNTAAVTIGRALSPGGPVTVASDSISVEAAVVATDDRVTFQGAGSDDSKGTLSNTSDGTITADNLLIRNIHNASLRSHDNVSVNTVASTGGHRLLLANDQALEVGTVSGVNGVSATEWVAIDTTTGDLSITQPVGTTLTTSSWGLRLRAGTATAFETASGGDVTVSGSGAINVPNAQTQVFSGSAAGSTGLSALSATEVVSEVAPTVAAGEVGVAYRAGPPAFSSATTMRFDDELTLLAADPAGGSVTYSKVSGDCSLDGSTVEPTGVGDCVMRATASGSGLTTDTTISISKAPQSIAFASSVPTSAVSGTRYTPSATATSGLTVEFAITSGSPSVCTLAGGVVEFQSAGSCTIEASIADGQSGAANYLAATAVSQTIVAGKINQTISFSVIADRNYGDPSFTAGATVSSGRTVTYSSPGSSSSVCRVNSSTGVVDILDVGDCTITASSAGDSSYASAADVTRTFTVRAVVPGKASLTSASFGDQRITVGFIAPESNGGAAITGYRAVATPAGGGSAIQQTCGSVSPCTVTGLTNGTEYTVTLAAINSAGLASASDASPAVTPATAPESVSNLRTSPGNQQLVVAWTRAEDFGGGTFTAYEVYLRESGQSWPGSATQTMSSESDETVTLTGLTNGTAYDVKVVTVSSANQTEIAGTNLAVAFGVPVTVADAPTGLSVTALSSTTALASWKAPADNGGTVITAYSVSPGCDFDTATDTYCTLTGLTPSSSVTVSVGATNFVGTGATTQAVVAMPAAPRNDSGSNDSDDSDDSPAQVVAPPMSPSAVPTADQPRRLPVGPGPAVRPDVVTGPMQFPGGPSGPLTTPRGFVGGVPAPVRTTPSADGGFDVSTSTLRLGLRPGVTPGGSASSAGGNSLPGATPGDSAGSPSEGARLSEPQGGYTVFRGGGLLPGSALQVFLPGSFGAGGGAELARIPVTASGEFDGEVGFGRNLDQMPMPIGEQVLQAVGYDENGNQVVVELPVNIAQGAPTPEWDREAGGVPGLGFGEAMATSAGVPESVTITVLPDIGQVNAAAGDWSFSIRVADDAGSVEQAGSSANVRLIRDRAAEASGSGFQPGTRVDMWLFSEPTLLGSVTVGDDGEFVGEFFLDPRFATVGEHTLQLQGVGTDGFVKAVNMGVTVDDAVGAASTGANTLLWWALGGFLAIVIALVLFALLSRRSQRA